MKKYYDASKEHAPFDKLTPEQFASKYSDRKSRSAKRHRRGPNVRTCNIEARGTAVKMAAGGTQTVNKVWYRLRDGACVSHKLA